MMDDERIRVGSFSFLERARGVSPRVFSMVALGVDEDQVGRMGEVPNDVTGDFVDSSPGAPC